MAYRGGDIEVLHWSPGSVASPEAHYEELQPGTSILPRGHRKSDNHRAFRATTVFERDIEIPLRDGTIIRADVFRPEGVEEQLPALVAWSPYGKSGTGHLNLGIVPGRVGVPQHRLSGYESFEAPDPAEWTARGYAIVNVNARGSFDSEGDIRWFGTGEGQDGYDTVEHLATLPWCNGKIALVGNSWLAMAQWYIAAERPPHLACFAPLEGCSDFYRESVCRGGVPYTPFWGFLSKHGIFGRNQQENVIGMIEKYPLMNQYWEDKRARVENIQVPGYVLASYSTALHTVGSFRGFEDLPHDNKWLRVHPTQEWHDLYTKECTEDLQLFFDRNLKDKNNGWEKTPRVRLSVLRFNQAPEYNHAFPDWPIPDTKYRTFYLSQAERLLDTGPEKVTIMSYQSDAPSFQVDEDPEQLSFVYTFEKASYLAGYSKAILFVSCAESDDMDVFVQLRKADSNDKVLQNINIPLDELQMKAKEVTSINTLKYLGPSGILRASHRKIDIQRSKPHWPLHSHDKKEPVTPGQVVKLEIGLWPTGIKFEAGEKLVFRVAGHHMTLAEFEPLRGGFRNGNKGRHNVHLGGEYASHVIVPFVELPKSG